MLGIQYYGIGTGAGSGAGIDGGMYAAKGISAL